jgi:hypothetical protein
MDVDGEGRMTPAVPAFSTTEARNEIERREMMAEEARTDRQTAYELEEREGQCWAYDGECLDCGGYCDWRDGDCLRLK